jgi:triosephosphate isomerase
MTASRRYVFAGNWKMYKTVPEAVALVKAIRAGLDERPTDDEVVVFPAFTALHAAAQAAQGSRVGVGGQTMYWEKEGAFTGEVSPVMLKDIGCTHVLLGHSERRHVFGETDEAVGRKARAAWDHGLLPVACVGETLPERESGRTLEVVERQLEQALRYVTPDEVGRMLVAYEPVWAIGTGKVATPEQAEEVQAFIRKRIEVSHGDVPAEAVRILYGGSVKPENTAGLMIQGDIDGVLVGGASLKADSFLGIVRNGRPEP